MNKLIELIGDINTGSDKATEAERLFNEHLDMLHQDILDHGEDDYSVDLLFYELGWTDERYLEDIENE